MQRDGNKYELTEERKFIDNHVACRIRALRDFSDVKVGDLGGFCGIN